MTGVESGFDKNCGSGRGEVGTISSSASTSTVSRSVQEGFVASFDDFLHKSSLVLITLLLIIKLLFIRIGKIIVSISVKQLELFFFSLKIMIIL